MDIIKALQEELNIGRNQVEAAVKLIDEGNTIPFIARYRKEATGSLDDEVLRNLDERLRYLRNLEEKKTQVVATIREQGKLTKELEEQIAQAKARIAPKFRGSRYIAYFQAYTNTYAPVERLKALFEPVIHRPDIAALSIATRPDCLPEEVLDLLGELNHIKPVWVELGLQTIHPKTAAYIRRGYDLPCYDRAVRELNARGIHVVTHVILGLPGESRQQMLETVDYAAQSGSGGIKLQLLHVLEGTDLAEDYRAGKFTVMTLEEYVALVSACVRRLPEDMVLHRMTGDGPKRILLAPLWSGDKKRVLNALNRALAQERRDSDVLSLSAGQ